MFWRRLLVAAVAVMLALSPAACDTLINDHPSDATALQPRTALPAATTEIIPAGPAAAVALATSRALFTHAPVVTLASEHNFAGQRAAAGLATQLGAPLLLVPGGQPRQAGLGAVGDTGGTGAAADRPGTGAGLAEPAAGAGGAAQAVDVSAALRQELVRLAPATLVPYDDPAADWARQALVDWDEAARGGATTAPAGDPVSVEAPGATATGDRSTSPAAPPVLVPAGGDLPNVAPAEPLASLLVLTSDADGRGGTFAATVTARAAGARVLALPDPDPRGDPTAIETLAGAPPQRVLAIGDGFGPPERLRLRLEVAATGVQLPGGGQRVFPGRRMVALYGHPGDPVLGVLGEQPVSQAVDRAREVAGAYAELVNEPVVPVFEIITTVASGSPGPEGDYSLRTPVAQLRPWVDAAAAAGVYVVLDLQPGRTDFLSQAELYEELLLEPHVGLALDPEWRLAPDQVHLEQIGTVTAAEVNQVADWLAALTREHLLPQKLLVLHQFRLDMITGRSTLATGHDELSVLIHADGHGTPEQKLATWRALRADPPDGVWWGWKNFYDEDQPMLTPASTVEIEPSPWFVSYQ